MILDKNDREERLVKKAMRGNVDAYGKVVDIYKEYLYKMAWLYAVSYTHLNWM